MHIALHRFCQAKARRVVRRASVIIHRRRSREDHRRLRASIPLCEAICAVPRRRPQRPAHRLLPPAKTQLNKVLLNPRKASRCHVRPKDTYADEICGAVDDLPRGADAPEADANVGQLLTSRHRPLAFGVEAAGQSLPAPRGALQIDPWPVRATRPSRGRDRSPACNCRDFALSLSAN
jgi:hypothetical protein